MYRYVVMVVFVLLVYFGEKVQKLNTNAGFCGLWCEYCLTIGVCYCIMHKPARLKFCEAYGLVEGEGVASDFCASWCCSSGGVC